MDQPSFALLYQKYLSGICTPEETDAFHQFMMKPEAEAMLRELLHETYTGIRTHSATLIDAGGRLVPAPEMSALPHLLPRKQRLRRLRQTVITTALALAAGFGFWFAWSGRATHTNREPGLGHPALTARSGYRKLVLPDSTIVWLNKGSHLDFPNHFGKDSREVTLSGEGYFDVKHAAEKPFLIHTGRIVTRVIGTAFNINAYPRQHSVTVSVSRGRVQVFRGGENLATLVKGQQVRIEGDSARPIRKLIPVARVAAWQTGNLDYDDQALEEVVADLSRVFDTPIRIENPKLRQVHISTRLREEEGLPQALEILGKLTESHTGSRNNMYFIQ